jgi:hypothetical protein
MLDRKILDTLLGCLHRDDKEVIKREWIIWSTTSLDHGPHDMGSHAPVKLIKPFSAESKVIQALAMVVSLQAMTILDLWRNVATSDPRHNWINDIPLVISPLASKALEFNHGSWIRGTSLELLPDGCRCDGVTGVRDKAR